MNGPLLGAGALRAIITVRSLISLARPLLCRRRRRRLRLRGSLWSPCPRYAGSHVPGAPAMPSPTGKAMQTLSHRARSCRGHQGSTATHWLITQSHLMKNWPRASRSHPGTRGACHSRARRGTSTRGRRPLRTCGPLLHELLPDCGGAVLFH